MLLQNQHEAKKFTVGGKANGLFRLIGSGFPVPDFAVIPAEVFDKALKGLPATEAGAVKRKKQLQNFTLPASVLSAIEALLKSWKFPQQPVVVRSSIADEDGKQYAFPGIMDSYLNLITFEDVLDAIRNCAASAYSDRALAYRIMKGLTQEAKPAVILQRQVQPVASGVMFSTFPEYPQELAIHASWGFGEGLVQGAVDADEFYFLKSTGVVHRKVLAQKEAQLISEEAGGLQTAAVAEDIQKAACLTAPQLQELYAIGTHVEKAFGSPQDIEFVVSEDAVFIVQARPITQAIPEVIVYDNSNIQESYCGVTTPLTFSFARRAYATVYRQTMQVLGLPHHMIQAQEQVVTQLLGLVKGRIYYNINNWYRGLQLLPSFKQNKADMERMMGLEEPVDFVEDREKTLLEKAKLLPGLLINLSRLLWAFSRLHQAVPAFHAHFQKHYSQFYQQHLHQLGPEELLNMKKQLDRELLQNWTTPIINDFYVMMMNGRVARKLKKADIQDTDEFLSRYLSGDHQIESTQPTRAMQALAHQAWPLEELCNLILALPEDVHQQVQEKFPAFHAQAEAFIAQYGDRTVGELKLETQTMRLQPLIFYKYLRNYLVSDAAPAPVQESNTSLNAEARAELQELLKDSGWLFRRKLWKSLEKLQQAIRYRESLRLERTRLFGMYRALYLRMGTYLQEQEMLKAARDVFYLEEQEIEQALKETAQADFKSKVQHRSLEFSLYRKEDVPARVVVPSPPVIEETSGVEVAGMLRGTGCFQGVVTGEVLVITEPGGDLNVSGKIICALRTDPGWAALFPTCLGVLIEKGSSLSHSVILLRELGIPTIINVPGLTKRLKSGEQVLMNGSTGEIQIVT
ncbi:phosphoenolpyruvate synthase [Pontibacter diazotrophicus]|uniref:Phosphoenolpyruvate synthase n=1 Tax=Pontibacter diazotrophicus TaxID=1400979 RepID=A0A3D8LAX5_9BACT|nr:PEP/pyruvate-binding domain-containing protein [Pontibacter diazotrophicus]RDV14579.1 phosphoenolpyruvate synthase [Pontibacter diazotrophicus]